MRYSPYGTRVQPPAPLMVPSDQQIMHPGIAALAANLQRRAGKDPRNMQMGPQIPVNPYSIRPGGVPTPAAMGAAGLVQSGAPPGQRLSYAPPGIPANTQNAFGIPSLRMR